jgi:hypothetical protein
MIGHRGAAADRSERSAAPAPTRWFAVAAGVGGALWIMMAAWDATNPGESDLGLMPSSIRWFLIIPSLVLISYGVIGLGRINGPKARPWVLTGLVGAGLGLVRVGFDIWQLYVGIVALMIVSIALAVQAFRTRTVPQWTALLLAAGTATFSLGSDQGTGPWLWAGFGVGWVAAGYGMWTAASKPALRPIS